MKLFLGNHLLENLKRRLWLERRLNKNNVMSIRPLIDMLVYGWAGTYHLMT